MSKTLNCSSFTRLEYPTQLKYIYPKLIKNYNEAYDDLAKDEEFQREHHGEVNNPEVVKVNREKNTKHSQLRSLENQVKVHIEDFRRYMTAQSESTVAKKALEEYQHLFDNNYMFGEELSGVLKKISMYKSQVGTAERLQRQFPSFKKRLDLEQAGRDEIAEKGVKNETI